MSKCWWSTVRHRAVSETDCGSPTRGVLSSGTITHITGREEMGAVMQAPMGKSCCGGNCEKSCAFVAFLIVLVVVVTVVTDRCTSSHSMRRERTNEDSQYRQLLHRSVARKFPVSLRRHQSIQPILIHIPKTAGTSIEMALEKHGILVGAYSSWRDAPSMRRNGHLHWPQGTYETNSSFEPCSPWHRPPMYFVSKSLCILRDPVQRIISEFCFSGPYAESSGRGHSRVFPETCEGLNFWVKFVLKLVVRSPTIHDCHLLPQWEFATKSDLIIDFNTLGDKEDEGPAWSKIRRHFGVPELRSFSVEFNHTDAGLCKNMIAQPGCLQEGTVQLIQEHYQRDYELLKTRSWLSP